MIYTSYFSNYRNFPQNFIPIGITRYPPKNWKGINLDILAPSEELLKRYKNKEIDEYIFKKRYFKELSDKNLTSADVRQQLEELGNIILCCYEKPDDFCHRHLLAEWLGEG